MSYVKMSYVFVVYYPYSSKGVVAVYLKETDAKFLVAQIDNSEGSAEYKKMMVRL